MVSPFVSCPRIFYKHYSSSQAHSFVQNITTISNYNSNSNYNYNNIKLFTHLLDDFCNYFYPLDYFKLQSQFHHSGSCFIATTPTLDVLAYDILASQ